MEILKSGQNNNTNVGVSEQSSYNMSQDNQKQHSLGQFINNNMKTIILLLTLLSLIKSQNCCSDPTICPPGSNCLCQGTVCMLQIGEEQQTFNLTNTNTSFFYWAPTTDTYSSILLFLCPQNLPNYTYNFGIDIQNQNGTGYPTNLTINFTSGGSNRCKMYDVKPGTFCKVPNGSYCQLRIAVQLISPATSELSIFINSIEGTTKFIIPIVSSIGVLLIVIIIILIVCVIKKRMQARRNALNKVDNDINHFDELIPKRTLEQTIQVHNIPPETMNCSVCLVDLQSADTVRRTPCGHIFHADCMDVWCKRNLSCPMCRQALDSDSMKKKAGEDSSLVLMPNQSQRPQENNGRIIGIARENQGHIIDNSHL